MVREMVKEMVKGTERGEDASCVDEGLVRGPWAER